MRILGIDPGYERLGIAVLEKQKGGKETYLFSECFQTLKKETHAKRLALLQKEMRSVIEKWKPEALAIETLFLTVNQKTAMYVAEARGVILAEAATHDLTIFEYSPPQIKAAVAGNGAADKKAMIKMVPMLIKIPSSVTIDDEFDAIAAALSAFAIERF